MKHAYVLALIASLQLVRADYVDHYYAPPAPHKKCDDGYSWNETACDCFSVEQCDFTCPYGQSLDPRHFCRCMDDADLDKLYACELKEDEPEEEECELGHEEEEEEEVACDG